jgi:mediator of RNA polymerase II transcription subunit 8
VQSSQRALLASLAVYPLPAYPGRSEEGLLEQLLRKKLEPGVEDWVERGRDAGLAATRAANTSTATATGEQPQPQMSRDELREIWAWAGGAANEQARAHPWGGDFTREEVEQGVEGVQTGLRRKLRAPGEDESSDEDDDEDEDEDMEDVAEVGVRRKSTAEGQGLEFDILKETGGKGEGKPMPLAQQWRFMLTGQS